MIQVDYSSNLFFIWQWFLIWLKQCMYFEIFDQNNNIQDIEENGELFEEDREEDKECLRIYNYNFFFLQLISFIENN